MLNARRRAGECSSRPAPLPRAAHTSRHGMPTARKTAKMRASCSRSGWFGDRYSPAAAGGDEPGLGIDPLERRRADEAEHAAAAAFAGCRRDGDLPGKHDKPRRADPAEQRQQQTASSPTRSQGRRTPAPASPRSPPLCRTCAAWSRGCRDWRRRPPPSRCSDPALCTSRRRTRSARTARCPCR